MIIFIHVTIIKSDLEKENLSWKDATTLTN